MSFIFVPAPAAAEGRGLRSWEGAADLLINHQPRPAYLLQQQAPACEPSGRTRRGGSQAAAMASKRIQKELQVGLRVRAAAPRLAHLVRQAVKGHSAGPLLQLAPHGPGHEAGIAAGVVNARGAGGAHKWAAL